MKTKFLLFAGLAASSVAMAQQSITDYANVTSVVPRAERVAVNREVCETRYISGARVEPAQPNVGGAVLGTVIGGVIGSRFGGGDGRLAATAVGAGLGAAIGANSGGGQPSQVVTSQPVRECRMETTYETQTNGYLVTYEYMGRQFVTTLPRDPGNQMRVNVTVTPSH